MSNHGKSISPDDDGIISGQYDLFDKSRQKMICLRRIAELDQCWKFVYVHPFSLLLSVTPGALTLFGFLDLLQNTIGCLFDAVQSLTGFGVCIQSLFIPRLDPGAQLPCFLQFFLEWRNVNWLMRGCLPVVELIDHRFREI